MNKDLENLINEFRTGYNSWNSLLPEGNHFEWKFIINSTEYKLNRFDPKIINFKSEWSLWEILKGSSNLIVSGDEKIILEFFKPQIRDKKLKEILK
jgi:hypothetical protein